MAVRLCEFESHPPYFIFYGAIAQLVEQRTENPCVTGSIPVGTTTGRLDEWFSHWSAKPVTAVRVRYRPQFLIYRSLSNIQGCQPTLNYRSLSSVGSERLPYKQRVGGSNPSATTLGVILLSQIFLQYFETDAISSAFG